MADQSLQWYVFVGRPKGGIKNWNVFEHTSFAHDVQKLGRETLDYKEFSNQLRSRVMHNFWRNSENEVLIASLFVPEDVIKISVYDQITFNWDAFSNYVYDNFKGGESR